MKKIVLSILVVWVSFSSALSQGDRIFIKADIIAEKANQSADGNNVNEYRFKVSFNGQHKGCIMVDGYPGTFYYNSLNLINQEVEDFTEFVIAPDFFEDAACGGWNCDFKDNCTILAKDKLRCTNWAIFKFKENRGPGVEHTVDIPFCSDQYVLKVRYIYSPPRPNDIFKPGTDNVCGGEYFTMSTSGTPSGGNYVWQEKGADGNFYDISIGSSITLQAPTNVPNEGITKEYRVFTIINGWRSVNFQSKFIYVKPPAPTGINKSVTNVTCYGGNNGRIKINSISGGIAPYRISLTKLPDTPLGGPSNVYSYEYTGLSQGTYQLTVTNSNGYCNYVENIVISQPPLLKVVGINSPTFNTYNIKCNGGDDGSMSIVATGGTVPYTYFIGRGAIEFSNSTGSFSNLEAGTYTVEVRDKVGCYATSTKVMYQPAKFNVSFYPEDIKCNGNNDGRIMANPSGGLTPYGFSVNNGASFVNNQIISGLSPGTYLCIAKDANGCLVKDTLVLSEPEKLILSVTEVQDVSCFAGIDGAISLTASGGKGNLKYGINEGTFQESPVFTDLPAGEQVVKVQDANNCITSDTVLILQPEQLVINFHVAHVQCTGFNNGIVRAEVSGGIAPYTYNWQGLQDTDSIIEGLEPGTYKLSIRDAHQCPFSQTIEVTEPEDVLSAVISYKKDAHCNANCTGIAEVEVSGGTAPYSYFWNDKDSTNSFRADSLCKGTYLVKILDSRNCVASESVTINDSIHYSINIPPQTILCPGQTVTMKTDLTGVFHQWYKGSTLLSYNSSILLNEEGNYHVYVKDRHDCYQNASFYIKTSNELLDAKFLLSSFEELGDTIVLTEISWPRPDSVHWSFGNSPIILSNDPIQPVLYYPNEGTFNIKLTAYLGECIDSVQKNVTFFVAPANSPEDTTVLGVNKIKELKLYPNPNNGQFTLEVKLDQEDIVNLSIYTSQGNEVSSLKNWGKDDYKFYYNLPRNPGIYMLKVTTTTDYKSLIFVVE